MNQGLLLPAWAVALKTYAYTLCIVLVTCFGSSSRAAFSNAVPVQPDALRNLLLSEVNSARGGAYIECLHSMYVSPSNAVASAEFKLALAVLESLRRLGESRTLDYVGADIEFLMRYEAFRRAHPLTPDIKTQLTPLRLDIVERASRKIQLFAKQRSEGHFRRPAVSKGLGSQDREEVSAQDR